jgi:tetratricopeptide (TPR) repeat protein
VTGTPATAGLPPAPPDRARRLAAALSVATRIEPELLRSMRLTAFPDLDAGDESDLWFSEWVESRGPGGIVMLPQVLPVLRAGLRQMLRTDPSPANPVARVWEVISQAHRDISPALFLEEHVTWLAVAGEGNKAQIEEELGKALAALVREGRTGIADWLAGAWPRFPAEVLETTTAWQLGAVAARHADLGRRPELPATLAAADVAVITSALDDVPLPLRRDADAVFFGAVSGRGVSAIPVPDTDPVVIEIESVVIDVESAVRPRRQSIQVPKGQVVRVPVGGSELLVVHSPRGAGYVIERSDAEPTSGPAPDGSSVAAAEASPRPAGPSSRALLDRYLQDGDLDDLDTAIDAGRLAIGGNDSPDPDLLTDLADALHERFLQVSDETDLASAYDLARQAVASAPEAGETSWRALLSLAAILLSRYEWGYGGSTGVQFLDEALNLARRALALRPGDGPERASSLARIAEILRTQFTVRGDLADLEEAIDALREAIAMAPPDHRDVGQLLSNFGSALLTRFRALGRMEDVDQAVTALQRSAAATSLVLNRAATLASLSAALRARFDAAGIPADLDQAIDCGRQALDILPAGHLSRQPVLSALGGALLARFTLTRANASIDEAIAVLWAAADATPDGRPDGPLALANLANALHTRFNYSGDRADLDAAASLALQAAAASSPQSPGRAACLASAAGVLFSRYQLSGEAGDVEQAIEFARTAVATLPPVSPDRPSMLLGLAQMLQARAAATPRQSDIAELAEAVAVAREALSSIAVRAPLWAQAASLLAGLLREHAVGTGNAEDTREALMLWQRAAGAETAPVPVRLDAAIRAAGLAASLAEWAAALDSYRRALELLQLGSWRHATAGERARALAGYGPLGEDAAACALQLGQPEAALELLEVSRGLFWGYVLDARTDLAELRAVAPSVADRLEAIRRQLDKPDPAPAEPPGGTAAELPRTAPDREAAAREWDELLATVRTIPGFESFLGAPSRDDYRDVAAEGPVVVLNASRIRCDALVLTRFGTSIVPLLTDYETIVGMASSYAEAWRSPDRETTRSVSEVAEWLWTAIVAPVLAQLDLPAATAESAPRLWWCPTGPLTELPLHTAGNYSGALATDSALYRVSSSYTPTLRALRQARRAAVSTAADVDTGMLVVADTQGNLRGVQAELALLRDLVREPLTALTGRAATKSVVLAELTRRSAVHFACHSTSADDPAQSGLVMGDGTLLTVADLAASRFPHGTFAYLSTDAGAAASDLPGVVTTAAAFHFGGFVHVIAALSAVTDKAAFEVSKQFYQAIVDVNGVMRPERSAEAMRLALLNVRARSPEAFFLSLQFVHIGP